MIERFFTMNGEIQRKTIVSDNMGWHEDTWLSIMTSKGRLDALSGSEKSYAMKANADSTHVWICSLFLLDIEDPSTQSSYFGSPFSPSPYGELLPANINEGDRMLIDGKYYDITFIDDPMNFSRYLEIELKRWEGDNV